MGNGCHIRMVLLLVILLLLTALKFTVTEDVNMTDFPAGTHSDIPSSNFSENDGTMNIKPEENIMENESEFLPKSLRGKILVTNEEGLLVSKEIGQDEEEEEEEHPKVNGIKETKSDDEYDCIEPMPMGRNHRLRAIFSFKSKSGRYCPKSRANSDATHLYGSLHHRQKGNILRQAHGNILEWVSNRHKKMAKKSRQNGRGEKFLTGGQITSENGEADHARHGVIGSTCFGCRNEQLEAKLITIDEANQIINDLYAVQYYTDYENTTADKAHPSLLINRPFDVQLFLGLKTAEQVEAEEKAKEEKQKAKEKQNKRKRKAEEEKGAEKKKRRGNKREGEAEKEKAKSAGKLNFIKSFKSFGKRKGEAKDEMNVEGKEDLHKINAKDAENAKKFAHGLNHLNNGSSLKGPGHGEHHAVVKTASEKQKKEENQNAKETNANAEETTENTEPRIEDPTNMLTTMEASGKHENKTPQKKANRSFGQIFGRRNKEEENGTKLKKITTKEAEEAKVKDVGEKVKKQKSVLGIRHLIKGSFKRRDNHLVENMPVERREEKIDRKEEQHELEMEMEHNQQLTNTMVFDQAWAGVDEMPVKQNKLTKTGHGSAKSLRNMFGSFGRKKEKERGKIEQNVEKTATHDVEEDGHKKLDKKSESKKGKVKAAQNVHDHHGEHRDFGRRKRSAKGMEVNKEEMVPTHGDEGHVKNEKQVTSVVTEAKIGEGQEKSLMLVNNIVSTPTNDKRKGGSLIGSRLAKVGSASGKRLKLFGKPSAPVGPVRGFAIDVEEEEEENNDEKHEKKKETTDADDLGIMEISGEEIEEEKSIVLTQQKQVPVKGWKTIHPRSAVELFWRGHNWRITGEMSSKMQKKSKSSAWTEKFAGLAAQIDSECAKEAEKSEVAIGKGQHALCILARLFLFGAAVHLEVKKEQQIIAKEKITAGYTAAELYTTKARWLQDSAKTIFQHISRLNLLTFNHRLFNYRKLVTIQLKAKDDEKEADGVESEVKDDIKKEEEKQKLSDKFMNHEDSLGAAASSAVIKHIAQKQDDYASEKNILYGDSKEERKTTDKSNEKLKKDEHPTIKEMKTRNHGLRVGIANWEKMAAIEEKKLEEKVQKTGKPKEEMSTLAEHVQRFRHRRSSEEEENSEEEEKIDDSFEPYDFSDPEDNAWVQEIFAPKMEQEEKEEIN